jgi:prophage antirepressor-like protein
MKYNEIVRQFQDNVFGTLTTIRSQKLDGKIWFVGKEIQDILEFKDLSQAIQQADLDEDEIFSFNKVSHAGFFTDFVKHYTRKDTFLKRESSETISISKYSKSITFISESGLYALILNSRKPHAKAFKKWVTKKVLPTLRSGVEPDLTFNYAADAILKHTNVLHQKYESSMINWTNISSGGVKSAMDYNIKNCKDHSGSTPAQLKRWAADEGIPASRRTSGKEVLRIVDMPTASAMSLNDNLVSGGLPYDKALKLSNGAGKELFKQMIEMGIKPKELEM